MWDCANTELLLRYILHECRIDILKTNKDLLDYISAHNGNVRVCQGYGMTQLSRIQQVIDS